MQHSGSGRVFKTLSSCHWTGVLVLAPAAVNEMDQQEGAAEKQTGPDPANYSDPANCSVAAPPSQPATPAGVKAETGYDAGCQNGWEMHCSTYVINAHPKIYCTSGANF